MSTIRVIGREDIQKVFTVTAALRAVESAYAGKSAGTAACGRWYSMSSTPATPISTSNPVILKARAYTA